MAIITGTELNTDRVIVNSGEGTIVFRFEVDGVTVDKRVRFSKIGINSPFIVPRATGAGRVNNPDYRGFYMEGSSLAIVNDAAIPNTGATTYIFLGGVTEPSRIDSDTSLAFFGGVGSGTINGVEIDFNRLFHDNQVGSVVSFNAGDIQMDSGSMIFVRALGAPADNIVSGGDIAEGSTSVTFTDTITASAGQNRFPLSRFARSLTSVTVNGAASTSFSLLGAVVLYNGSAPLAAGDTVVIEYVGDTFVKAGGGRFLVTNGNRAYVDSDNMNFPFLLEDNESIETIGSSYVVI